MQPLGDLHLLALEQRKLGVLAESGAQGWQPGAESGVGKGQALDKPAFLLRVEECSTGLTAEGKVAVTMRRGGREQLTAIALRGCTLLGWSSQKHLRKVEKYFLMKKYFEEAPDRGGQALLV